jgi:hypothetical protein
MDYKDIPTVEIADKLVLKRGTNGNWHCFRSEYHNNNDQNASLSISSEGKGFKCFGCGIQGNNVQLIKEVLKLDTRSAIKWLNENFTSTQDWNQRSSSQGYLMHELIKDQEKMQIRLIQKGKKRFLHKLKSELRLKNPTEQDVKNIKNWLGKSYSLQTLLLAGIKINHKSGFYGLVFPKGQIQYNPNDFKKYIHLEGRTDFLTAIELGLQYNFGLISDYNKTSLINIDSDQHWFIMDKDVDEQQIRNRINTPKSCKIGFLRLPEKYQDLSEYYNLGNCTKEDIIALIEKNTLKPVDNNSNPSGISSRENERKPESNINNEEEPEFTIRLMTAADLQNLDIKPTEYIIKDFLPKSGSLLLSGSPKLEKQICSPMLPCV